MNSLKYLKELSDILKNSSDETKLLDNFIYGIAKVLDSDVVFVDNKGYIIKEITEKVGSIAIKNSLTDEIMVETQLIVQLSNINKSKLNITLDNLYTNVLEKNTLKNTYGLFLPIFIANKKLGLLIIYKNNEKFEEDIEIITKYIESVIGILISNTKNSENAEEARQKATVKSSIGTLSFSELEAILSIFEELDGEEGLLVASKIADKSGITRSVIVNALRKFESASIIESRSLGMKGTYIKVLNKYLLEELYKYKK